MAVVMVNLQGNRHAGWPFPCRWPADGLHGGRDPLEGQREQHKPEQQSLEETVHFFNVAFGAASLIQASSCRAAL
jgi:hypothetical protein